MEYAVDVNFSFLSLSRSFRYPWGQEAFDKAKREDKLIFLSGNKGMAFFVYGSICCIYKISKPCSTSNPTKFG